MLFGERSPTRPGSTAGSGRVYADPAHLDDPERPVKLRARERVDERRDGGFDVREGCRARQTENSDPGVVRRWKSDRVREIQIERDERASFSGADTEQLRVLRTRQALLGNGCDVVAGSAEAVGSPSTEILVKLQLHALSLSGRSA